MSEKGRAAWPPERRLLQAARMHAMLARPDVQAKRVAAIKASAGRPRPDRYYVPERAHPLIRGLFLAINAEHATLGDIGSRTGVGETTLANWRRLHRPYVDLLDAALNALDLELVIVRRGRRGEDGFLRGAAGKRKGAAP